MRVPAFGLHSHKESPHIHRGRAKPNRRTVRHTPLCCSSRKACSKPKFISRIECGEKMKKETGSGYMPRLFYAMLAALRSLLLPHPSGSWTRPHGQGTERTAPSIRYNRRFTCETAPYRLVHTDFRTAVLQTFCTLKRRLTQCLIRCASVAETARALRAVGSSSEPDDAQAFLVWFPRLIWRFFLDFLVSPEEYPFFIFES